MRRPHPVVQILMVRRHKLGLRQRDVADRMGVNRVIIAEWEIGKRDPRLSNLEAYAHALNLRISFEEVGDA
ncbi:hypothetical protein DP939_02285 [Spongiactinospora rosea]|uniref:HTH cro/C1-type domain-containing protein n=1 Tax=Spongiactinospora rosea TaxID=2248750 RepID=A0A366M7N7_9ACTN|nr:helix-turn-helix transcriptional regulator [Spongiactinospora rosea]RBQ21559.1 hypothetical protein DP939_02285 [Spongiactinospora rosea]